MPRNSGDGQVGQGRLSPFLERQRITQALRFIPPNSDILDVGCGRAKLLSHLSSVHTYVGLDVLDEVVEENRKQYPQHRFFRIDVEQGILPTEGKFNIIIMLAIVEHLNNALITMSK